MIINFDIFRRSFLPWFVNSLFKLLVVLILLYIGFKVINKLSKKFRVILTKKNVDNTLSSFLEAFTNISLKIILGIFLLSYLGFDVASLAAILASAGLAVGLALQGSLSNFAGGVIILILRPFKLDDYIEGAGYSGTVDKITVFYTHLTTPDNKEILIPNGKIANESIVNYSSKKLRRVDLNFGVGYEEDILKVKKILSEIIDTNNLILQIPSPFVSLNSQGDSSLNFIVRVWCKNSDYWNVYFDILEKVTLRFGKENINIPFPQMDVHLKK